MKKIVFFLAAICIIGGASMLCFSAEPDEDQLIEDLYNSGAMTGYSSAPDSQPYWYRNNYLYYNPYGWCYYVPPRKPQGSEGYNIEVKPAGKILIQVEPLDAEVYADGKRLQQLPDLTYQVVLFAGTHHVDIIKEGYQKFSEDVVLQPGSGIVIPVKLVKAETKKK